MQLGLTCGNLWIARGLFGDAEEGEASKGFYWWFWVSLEVGDIPFMLPRGQLERVIKDRRTGRYYAASGVWTAEAVQAKVFEDLSLAFQTARHEGLQNCWIVVFWSGSREVDAQFQI